MHVCVGGEHLCSWYLMVEGKERLEFIVTFRVFCFVLNFYCYCTYISVLFERFSKEDAFIPNLV